MVRMVERLGQQPGDVVVDGGVVRKGALSADPHQLGKAKLGEVLGDSRRGSTDDVRQVGHRRLAVQECPEDLDARRICQHPEPIAGEANLFVSRHLEAVPACLRICMHVHRR